MSFGNKNEMLCIASQVKTCNNSTATQYTENHPYLILCHTNNNKKQTKERERKKPV